MLHAADDAREGAERDGLRSSFSCEAPDPQGGTGGFVFPSGQFFSSTSLFFIAPRSLCNNTVVSRKGTLRIAC